MYVNTDTANAVIVFDKHGKFLRSWGEELAGGLHGMQLREEDGVEYLYLAPHRTARGPEDHPRRRDPVGPRIPRGVPGCTRIRTAFRPTSVAVAPDGDLYVADGYGLSWIHVFGPDRKYKRSLGGHGGLVGQFATCHGIAIEEWNGQPALMVADRENNRLQVLSLDGPRAQRAQGRGPATAPATCSSPAARSWCRVWPGGCRCSTPRARCWPIWATNPTRASAPRTASGASTGAKGSSSRPTAPRWDSEGNLYVMDWNSLGRVSKLERVK